MEIYVPHLKHKSRLENSLQVVHFQLHVLKILILLVPLELSAETNIIAISKHQYDSYWIFMKLGQLYYACRLFA